MRSRVIGIPGLTLVVARFLVGASAVLATGHAIAQDRPIVFKLEPYRKGVAVRVEVNGHQGLFTLDTAGGITLISPTFAAAGACKPWGQLVGFRMTGEKLVSKRCDNFRFSASGHALSAPVVSVLDVTPLIAKDATPIDGSLALDVFADKTITIDFAGGTLTVETQRSSAARRMGATPVPIKLLREVGGWSLTPVIEVSTAKGTLGFELDSGNGGTLLVSNAYAPLFGLDPAAGPQRGTIPLVLGIVADGLVFTPDLSIDGNLGMPFLKDWAVTLDLKRGLMWLKRSQFKPPAGMGEPPHLQTK